MANAIKPMFVLLFRLSKASKASKTKQAKQAKEAKEAKQAKQAKQAKRKMEGRGCQKQICEAHTTLTHARNYINQLNRYYSDEFQTPREAL